MIKHFTILLMAIAAMLATPSCSCRQQKSDNVVAYHEKIVAFTSGTVSNQTAIRVIFEQRVPEAEPGKEASPSLMSISPSVNGKMYWEDNQTLVLQPEKKLPSGQHFEVSLKMAKIFPDEEGTFDFTFDVMPQNFKFEAVNLRPEVLTDLKLNLFTGKLIFADHEDATQIEKIVTVTQNGQTLDLTWEHQSIEQQHYFTAHGISRQDAAGSITIEWDGSPIDVDIKGSEEIEVPALGDFKIMNVTVEQQPTQKVIVQFSDPLHSSQSLDGLLDIENQENLRYEIDANLVTIYLNSRIQGHAQLIASPGIKNILAYEMKNRQAFDLAFEALMPQMEFIGKGTILPNSQGLILPFRTVSLRAIEVNIIKIFENNVASFLQINTMDGEDQLRRAGRLVLKKIILLDQDKTIDPTRWNTFSLDLANLIQPEPGAIYRVVLNMKKEFAIYPCEGEENEPAAEIKDEGITEGDIAYWDTPSAYSYSNWDYTEDGDYNDYDSWEDRDNPCKSMYYRNKSVSRNILASNIGLVAKGGTNKEIMVAVSDIRSTEPMANVELEILDYQNQIIGKAQSGSDGLARIDVSRKPYLLIAKKEKERGYMRLDDGSALSLSRFDISGQTIDKGLKGFIYGERGVWRPGDTLFLGFILEDKLKKIPAGHPLVFELLNPHGQMVSRQVAQINEHNHYRFIATTTETAPTGTWTGRVLVGGTSFEQPLRVETVKPNRLKIELDFGKEMIKKGESLSSTLTSKWLHGAIAQNLNANVLVTLNSTKTSFKAYPDYHFDDPTRSFQPEEINIFDGRLNDLGQANITGNLQTSEQAPGMLNAAFLTRVYEESGDFSVDRFNIKYAPYKSFVGLRVPKGDRRGMLLTDTTHTCHVVTVDADGNAVSRRNVKYFVYKIEWRWWWESSENDLTRYSGSEYQNLITSGSFNTTNGNGKFNFSIKYPDWGRYLIRVIDTEGGHACAKTVYVDWPGWALKPSANPQDAAMLTFNADKDKYATGENVTLTFPSPGVGRALVSIESGSRVLKAWWVETQKGVTNVTFEATPDMAPNVYAHITLLQPHLQTVNNLPIRLYGVIPIMVEDPKTRLEPVIDMADELQPGKTTTIRVKESSDQKMVYTVAVVDEGLLDLTRFTTPDPWNLFYAREALGVRTWDLYDLVTGAYGGRIEKAFSIGGGDDLDGRKGGDKTNRFKPMVKFMGPFVLEKGKTGVHTFTMPQYVGSVRTMVVASHQGSYGKAEKATPVRKPVMVLATLPRVLGPGETVALPVTVFAMKDNVKNVNVKLEISGPLEIIGESSTKVAFDRPGDKVVTFNLKVKEQIGAAKVTIKASAAGDDAVDVIDIAIRNPNPPVYTFVEKTIPAGASVTLDYTLPGMAGTNHGVLEVSGIPPVDFGRRLKYLLAYPHGCVEQTTSGVFPQLFLSDVMELTPETAKRAEQNIRAGINRLKQFINSDGGFGYWPNNNSSDDWGTSYAGHFYLEAEKKGYLLPNGWKKEWVKFQKKMARQASGSNHMSHFSQAYRLYTLALAGESDLSSMNRLRNEQNLSINAKWRLAAAYALAGQQDAASKMIENISTDHESTKAVSDYTYGSPDRNDAMIIETLALLNRHEKAMPLVVKLSKAMGSENWMSTQTTAYGLIALSRFAGKTSGNEPLKFEWSHNGKKQGSFTVQKSVRQDSLVIGKALNGQVTVTNPSKKVIYARVTMHGVPAIGEETASESNLRMSVSYTDMDGDAIEIDQIQQGTDFKAIVRISNPGLLGSYQNLALTQIFPSGWEIRNTRLENIQSAHEGNLPTYRDYRDDRVYTYFDLDNNRTSTYVVLLNATYKGRFYLPAANCEAMYDHTVNARNTGQWVEVK
ncbi:MAG: alpha-2-macroglobulin [Marinilabiliaceae bacterium]|nr:alpha-2-macroglobulin [Marinilabiliaceae bacterium]